MKCQKWRPSEPDSSGVLGCEMFRNKRAAPISALHKDRFANDCILDTQALLEICGDNQTGEM